MKLRNVVLLTLFTGALSGVAFAQTMESFDAMDKNGDSVISLQEATGTLSTEVFEQLDINGDGVLSKKEYGL